MDVVEDSLSSAKPPAEGNEKPEFTNVPLEGENQVKKKKPKRILHFSDGVLEEYSSDEEDGVVEQKTFVDPKSLTWIPWMWFYFARYATSTLSVADACGEKLARFFGITTPKYQYAIDEYYRLKEEEEKDKAAEERWEAKQQSGLLSSVQIQPEISDISITSKDEKLEKY